MNQRKLRALRKQAREEATETGFTNTNIQVKPVKSGRMVMNSTGIFVPEMVPVTTFTAVNKKGSYKQIYKQLKREVGADV